MINQKGGVFVRLSKKQLERLYEVRKPSSNTACGANALNILGLDFDIIQTLGEGGRSGESQRQVLEQLRRFINKVGRRETYRYVDQSYSGRLEWIDSMAFSVPLSKSGKYKKAPTNKERNMWKGWTITEKARIISWLKSNIPVGYITILGIPGHWVVVGRTANEGELIIIESQQGGQEGWKSQYTHGGAGIYIGNEAVEYLEETFRSQGDAWDNWLIIPSQVMLLDAAEPAYQCEASIKPNMSRQPSTFSDDDDDEEQSTGAHMAVDSTGAHMAAESAKAPARSTGFGAPAPSFGAPTRSTGFGAPAPSFGAPTRSTGFGAPAPSFGAPAPAFGSPAPAFGAPTRSTGFGAPAFRAPAPAFGSPAPAFGGPASTAFGAPGTAFGGPVRSTVFGAATPQAPGAFFVNTKGAFGGGISLKELMKPGTKVKPGKFALKK